MKIILILILFITYLFGENIEQNYEQLNFEIDEISTTLSLEEKLSLYYLVVSSHDKIITLLSQNATSLDNTDNLKNITLNLLTKLQNKYTLKYREIEHLKELYIAINNEALSIIEQTKLKSSKKVIKKQNYMNIIMSNYIIFSIFIMLTLGYLLYLEKKRNLKENFPLMLKLEHKNEQLNKQNELLKSNAKLIEENITKHDHHLQDEKSSIFQKDRELNNKITKLVKDLETTYNSHEDFISTQEQEIENLNKYIYSLKLEIKKYKNLNIHTYLN